MAALALLATLLATECVGEAGASPMVMVGCQGLLGVSTASPGWA